MGWDCGRGPAAAEYSGCGACVNMPGQVARERTGGASISESSICPMAAGAICSTLRLQRVMSAHPSAT